MDELLYEVKNRVAYITISREEKLNAISKPMYVELIRLMKEAEADDNVGVVVLTGAGKRAFSAGTDISKMGKTERPNDQGVVKPITKADRLAGNKSVQEAMLCAEHLKKPVIAALNGLAGGGGFEMALACDIRIASETAFFFLPEVSYGIMPGSGATQRLLRMCGVGVSKYMSLTCERIYANRALQMGIVSEVLPPEKLMARVTELAEKIASYPYSGLMLAKDAIHRGGQTDLDTGLDIEARNFTDCYDYPAAFQGIANFNNRKKK